MIQMNQIDQANPNVQTSYGSQNSFTDYGNGDEYSERNGYDIDYNSRQESEEKSSFEQSSKESKAYIWIIVIVVALFIIVAIVITMYLLLRESNTASTSTNVVTTYVPVNKASTTKVSSQVLPSKSIVAASITPSVTPSIITSIPTDIYVISDKPSKAVSIESDDENEDNMWYNDGNPPHFDSY